MSLLPLSHPGYMKISELLFMLLYICMKIVLQLYVNCDKCVFVYVKGKVLNVTLSILFYVHVCHRSILCTKRNAYFYVFNFMSPVVGLTSGHQLWSQIAGNDSRAYLWCFVTRSGRVQHQPASDLPANG